jgi:predicted MPP superfamily phosphohydrolase
VEWVVFIVTPIVLIVLFLFYYALFIEVNRAQVRHLTVRTASRGKVLKIAHLSDLHLYGGRSVKRAEWIKRTIDKTLAKEKPDLILITGDLIDNNSGIPLLDRVLTNVRAPHGVFAVLGNHDHFQYNFLHVFSPLFDFVDRKKTDMKRLVGVLNKHRVKLLSDRSVAFNAGGFSLRIAGLEYLTFKKKKIPAFPFPENGKSFKILLSHYPDVVRFPGKGWNRFDLVLAGHTHGGQVTLFGFPLIARSRVGRKKIQGASVLGRTVLFVSRGLGVSRYVPFRFFAAPEISMIKLEGEHGKVQ